MDHGSRQRSGLRGVELRRVGAGLTVIARFANALSEMRPVWCEDKHQTGIFLVFLISQIGINIVLLSDNQDLPEKTFPENLGIVRDQKYP